MTKKTKHEGMKFEDMTLEDLSEAKRELDEQRQELRTKLSGLTEKDKAAGKADSIRQELAQIRAAKLQIQEWQDKKAVPVTFDTTSHTIGVAGVQSGEAFGNIGGKPK